MAWSKLQKTFVGAVIVALAAYSAMEHQAQNRLRAQNEALQRQLAELQKANEQLAASGSRATTRLAASQLVNTAAALPATNASTANLFTRFKEGRSLLTPQQLDAFLQANGRRASTLLAAYRTGKDMDLLREALAKYPNDPQVTFEAATCPWMSEDEKRPWLKAFEQAAPDNALAFYLSAVDDLKTGRTEDALRELASVSGKHFDDYTQSREQDNVDAYLSAGYTSAEAQTIASESLLVPQASSVKDLGVRLVDLAKAYQQAGDQNSAQTVLQMAMNVGRDVGNAPSSAPVLIDQLVGLSIQSRALSAMDPNSVYGGQTVQDLLNQINQNGASIRALNQQAKPLLENIPDQDWVVFMNRRQVFGELPALQWVVNKYGQQQ